MKSISKTLFVICAAVALSSCEKDKSIGSLYVHDSIDGLWVKDCQIQDKSVVPMIEIDGNSGVYCLAIPDDEDYSNVSNANVRYDNKSGEGRITVEGGPSFDFLFDAAGSMVTSDSSTYFRINGSLSSLSSPALPPFYAADDPDMVGPSQYHDLSLNFPRLAGSSDLSSVSTDLMKWLAKNIAEGVAKGAGSKTASELYDLIFKSDEAKQMDQLLADVGEINNRLSELTELYHNTTYESYLNERTNSYLNPMINYNSLYLMMLEDCDGSDESLNDISTKWATTSLISGNSPTVQFLNFIDFLKTTVVEQKNLYQIYDTYVFNTHAWESEGYAMRESLRASDLAVIAESSYLALLYARCRTDISENVRENLLDQLNTAIGNFQSFYDKNPVVRHESQAICQINGAHFIMNRALEQRDYYKKPWFPNGTLWENEESVPRLVYGSTTSTPSAVRGQLFTNSDITNIFNYYKNSKYSNFWQVLTDAASCTYPFSKTDAQNKPIYIVTQDGGYYTRYDGTIFRFGTNNAIVAKDGFKRANTDFGKGELETVGFFSKDREFAEWTSYNSYLWAIPHIVQRY